MRTLVIAHREAALDREGLVRWLGSFSTVTGSVVVDEPFDRLRSRIRREIARVGPWRFVDVLAYRAYHRLMHAPADRAWEGRALDRLRARFTEQVGVPELVVSSPNRPESEAFIRRRRPDLVVARCKTILKESVFSIPPLGTYVMHPGVCPEYRNAHGCFWALAAGDAGNIGMTLLRVDHGVDTGPVFGYFRVTADPAHESHVVTAHRTVYDHLDEIRDTLLDIEAGRARPIDTSGRHSAAWGQPWLSAYCRMRARETFRARRPSAKADHA
jgi:hypothetical protein